MKLLSASLTLATVLGAAAYAAAPTTTPEKAATPAHSMNKASFKHAKKACLLENKGLSGKELKDCIASKQENKG